MNGSIAHRRRSPIPFFYFRFLLLFLKKVPLDEGRASSRDVLYCIREKRAPLGVKRALRRKGGGFFIDPYIWQQQHCTVHTKGPYMV